MRLYSVTTGLVYMGVGIESTAADLLARHLPAIDGMLGRAVVEEALPQPSPSAALMAGGPSRAKLHVPSNIPTLPGKDVKIVESYFQTGLQQRYTADPRDPGVKQSFVSEDLLLFENGIAYRAEATPSGALDSTVNAYGYATVDVADMKELPGRHFGRWKEDKEARSITVEWFGGHPVNYQRRGQDLVSGSLRATRKESLDGLRLEGRFEHPQFIGPPLVLALHKDGTFQAERVGQVLGGAIIDPAFPETGSGKYEVSRWTLILRFSNGIDRTVTLKYDKNEPHRFLLHTTEFKRTGSLQSP